MAYTVENYKTGAALKRDFLAGFEIKLFQPGGLFPLQNGEVGIEGPHYPKPHMWYASCLHRNGTMIALYLPGCQMENKRRLALEASLQTAKEIGI
jgi:hypothetical protein